MQAIGGEYERSEDTPSHSSRRRHTPHPRFANRTVALVLACALAATASMQSARAADNAVRIGLHLSPNTHVTAARTYTHLVSYQMNHMLMALLGSRAAPTTLLDARTAVIDVGADGAQVTIDDTSVRKYGGTAPKDTSSVTRHEKYTGALAADGIRTPPAQTLGDAGDGALDQLPHDPVAVGASWTFTRMVLLDLSLAQAAMTYTETLKSLSVRAGHTIATIAVTGTGMANPASDLAAKGFGPSTYALIGTAEFDVTAGLPGAQSYTAHVEWTARPLFTRIALDFDDTYAATAWTSGSIHS